MVKKDKCPLIPFPSAQDIQARCCRDCAYHHGDGSCYAMPPLVSVDTKGFAHYHRPSTDDGDYVCSLFIEKRRHWDA